MKKRWKNAVRYEKEFAVSLLMLCCGAAGQMFYAAIHINDWFSPFSNNSFHFITNQKPNLIYLTPIQCVFFSQIFSTAFLCFSLNLSFSLSGMSITFVFYIEWFIHIRCIYVLLRTIIVFATHFLSTFFYFAKQTTIFAFHCIVVVMQLQQIKCNQFSCCWLQLNGNWQGVVCECNEANSEMLCFWDSSTNKNAPADFRWWWCCC